jgi:hypothetical protein
MTLKAINPQSPKMKKEDPTASSPRKGGNAPHQSSEKLYNVLITITIFGVVTFIIALMTDSNGHMDEGHLQKELLLKEFLQKEEPLETVKKIQVNKMQQQNEQVQPHNHNNDDEADAGNKDHPPYHVVFSTSCIDQQHWESYVFFYHANKVKQPGTVTRIVSGCKKDEGKRLREFHANHIATMNPNFYLHMTADFSQLTRFQQLGDKNSYKYMNKPFGAVFVLNGYTDYALIISSESLAYLLTYLLTYLLFRFSFFTGLRDWMEKFLKMGQHDRPPAVEDGIVFLMDPDNILLRPIVHDFTNEDMIFVKDKPDWKVVEHGHPIAQQDGYLNNQWMQLNISYVTHGGNIDDIKGKDGSMYWNTGPPYLATVRDMYNIAVLWTEYAPRVYHIHPQLFAEMYGFIIATTQLELPHTLIKSIIVSTTGTNVREGWPYVDALPEEEVCDPRPDAPLPMGLHYCKRYLLGKWFFSKYRLKKKYISCETPLLASPPKDLAARHYDYAVQPPPHGHQGEWEAPVHNMTAKIAKREAFMICGLISLINEAAIHYKTTACNGTANMSTNYTFFSDPNH